MQKKIIFIIPHFGKFNNYFNIWLHSCKYNPTIDWLIFTDDRTSYNYPGNVKVTYTTFSNIVDKIQEKFDFKILLSKPYELCEFKVTYGEVFSEYIIGYDFWGYCDTDVIWGNLRDHITTDILNNYSKISWRGHLTLFKNDIQINKLFRTPVDGVDYYKYAFANTSGYPLAFDERTINYIFQFNGEKIYTGLMFADLKIRPFNFHVLHFPPGSNYKNNHQVFLWESGDLYRVYCYNNKVYKEDFAYIHFLKRPMKPARDFKLGGRFLIVPNKFINYSGCINEELLINLTRKRIYWSYLFSRLSISYIKSKVRYFKSKSLYKKNYSHLPLKTTEVILPQSKAVELVSF